MLPGGAEEGAGRDRSSHRVRQVTFNCRSRTAALREGTVLGGPSVETHRAVRSVEVTMSLPHTHDLVQVYLTA